MYPRDQLILQNFLFIMVQLLGGKITTYIGITLESLMSHNSPNKPGEMYSIHHQCSNKKNRHLLVIHSFNTNLLTTGYRSTEFNARLGTVRVEGRMGP